MHRRSRIPNSNKWDEICTGRYMKEREGRLILELTDPREGENVLSVGRDALDNLLIFRKRGCSVTGIEQPTEPGRKPPCTPERYVQIFTGRAEDLPFSDNEFDVVALIGALEFTHDPERAIEEAIRVCRNRVFLGVVNRYSFSSAHRKMCHSDHIPVHFFHLAKLRAMVRNHLGKADIHWGSVLFFPPGWYKYAAALEEAIPVMNNPFGAFFGLSFTVNYEYRTIQDPLKATLHFRADTGRPVPGAIRETNHARGNAL